MFIFIKKDFIKLSFYRKCWTRRTLLHFTKFYKLFAISNLNWRQYNTQDVDLRCFQLENLSGSDFQFCRTALACFGKYFHELRFRKERGVSKSKTGEYIFFLGGRCLRGIPGQRSLWGWNKFIPDEKKKIWKNSIYYYLPSISFL